MATFNTQKYISLETYRRNGDGIRTPVWFAAESAGNDGVRLYVYTDASSGKAKRLRREAKVRLAACNARGRVTGDWIDAYASIVGGDEYAHGMRLLGRKYFPFKQMLDLSVRLLRGHQRIMIVIKAR